MGKANEKIQQKEDDLNPFPNPQSELEWLQWQKEQADKAVSDLVAKLGDQPAAAHSNPKVEQAPDRS